MTTAVFEMYQQIGVGTCAICRNCIELHEQMGVPLSRPLSIWQVGSKFGDDPFKVMFVGKAGRGEAGEETSYGYRDGRPLGKMLFFGYAWPYWSYTREIVSQIYGTPEDGWDRIAFTNIIKCNNSRTYDTATHDMKANCIDKLRVVWREIEALKPRAVIFYTGWDYDDYIERFRFGDGFREITGRRNTRTNGMKTIGWWERHFLVNGGLALRFLRTAHPERQQKDSFVEKIVAWIRNTPAGAR